MKYSIRRALAIVLAIALVLSIAPTAPASDATYQTNVYIPIGGNSLIIKSAAGPGILSDNGIIHWSKRTRVTIAQVNAGLTLLAAIPGYGYRITGVKVIAVGGAVGALTAVTILATQAASPATLVSYAQANLTQSTVLSDNSTGATVLADGASYIVNDVNTAITIGKTGSTGTTATNVDVIIDYAIE